MNGHVSTFCAITDLSFYRSSEPCNSLISTRKARSQKALRSSIGQRAVSCPRRHGTRRPVSTARSWNVVVDEDCYQRVQMIKITAIVLEILTAVFNMNTWVQLMGNLPLHLWGTP